MLVRTAPSTERLYHTDAYLREFSARVLDVAPQRESIQVVVDRTAFYPTSGGQPHDTGTIDGLEVIDVVENGEAIVHMARAAGTGGDLSAAGQVQGRIDWPRRFDHMQQHTGQHVLSQAALQALGAQTHSVQIGSQRNTVDLGLEGLSVDDAHRVEDLANAVVMKDRAVAIREVTEQEVEGLGLRRPPKQRGPIRVVEIEDFDRSACRGTHVRRTGEVGVILLRRWERYKGGTRVEFLCGMRAVRDYRSKRALTDALGQALSTGEEGVLDAVQRGAARERELRMRADALLERLVSIEAARYRQGATFPLVIAEVMDGREIDEVQRLAGALVETGGVIALLGAGNRLVFARSADLEIEVADVLRRAVTRWGGRGGGRSDFAQGSAPPGAVPRVLAEARMIVEEHLQGA